MVFTTGQKVTKHLGSFCNKICYQEIPKITQSSHTGGDVDDGSGGNVYGRIVNSVARRRYFWRSS